MNSQMGRRSLMGMEVPIIASDSVKWVELSVLSSSSCAIDAAAAAAADSIAFAPLTEDYSSCSIIGDPPTYFFWYLFSFGYSFISGIFLHTFGTRS